MEPAHVIAIIGVVTSVVVLIVGGLFRAIFAEQDTLHGRINQGLEQRNRDDRERMLWNERVIKLETKVELFWSGVEEQMTKRTAGK